MAAMPLSLADIGYERASNLLLSMLDDVDPLEAKGFLFHGQDGPAEQCPGILTRRQVALISGPSGTGKSALLAFMVARVLAPIAAPPKPRKVWLVDMSARYPVERLRSETRVRLERCGTSVDVLEAETESALERVRMFRPRGSLGLLAVLRKLYMLLATQRETVDLLVVDHLSCPGDPASTKLAETVTALLERIRTASGTCVLLASREFKASHGWPSFWTARLGVQMELSLAVPDLAQAQAQAPAREAGRDEQVQEAVALAERSRQADVAHRTGAVRGTLRMHCRGMGGPVSSHQVSLTLTDTTVDLGRDLCLLGLAP